MRILGWAALLVMVAFGGIWFLRYVARNSLHQAESSRESRLPAPLQLTRHAPTAGSKAAGPDGATPQRIDPRSEATQEEISRILGPARLVAVACGEDVDQQTCGFFGNALRTDLADLDVTVSLSFQPETLVQSFYVPPAPLPFTDVTLRLIEDGPPDKTYLYLGGFCFDAHAQDEKGFQLPRWVVREQGNEVGPLEGDRANAARLIAREFSGYWHQTVRQAQPL
jgi:hypothetical protein